MKRITIIILLISFFNVSAQKIDKLNTNKKVAKFLTKCIDKRLTFEKVFDKENDPEAFADMVKRIDLDGDFINDLIVEGYNDLIIVLDEGDDEYYRLEIPSNKYFYKLNDLESIILKNEQTLFVFEQEVSEFDKIDSLDAKKLIIKKHQKVKKYDTQKKEYFDTIADVKYKMDTLTIVGNELVSYRKVINKNSKKVNKITFKTTRCFGSCPVFELELTRKCQLEYKGIMFTKHKKNTNKKLNNDLCYYIFELIDYIEWDKLKEYYTIDCTDLQTGTLILEFENGETKKIVDYGLLGTINLQALYNKLFEINKTVK